MNLLFIARWMLGVKRLLRRFSLAVLAIAVLFLSVMPGTLAAQITASLP
jgi:hypothetical protein